MKVKKGDTVIITSGRDKGKKGKVIQTYPEKSRLAVENINLRKKNIRARKSGEKGQVVEFPAPLHVSNVMFFCPNCLKAVKIGYGEINKKKERICKKCGKKI